MSRGSACHGPPSANSSSPPAASVMCGLLLGEVWAASLGTPAAWSRAQSALIRESVGSSKTNSTLRMNPSCRHPGFSTPEKVPAARISACAP